MTISQCLPFSWFMTNIASSVFTNFPAPPENSDWGLLAWADFPDLCWKPRSDSSLVHDDP